MKNLPILKLSTSSIKAYEKCPRQYYHRYIVKTEVPEVIQDHLVLGNFIHEVLEFFHNCLKKNPNKNRNQLMAYCVNAKKNEKSKDGKPKHPMTEEVKEQAVGLLKAYLRLLDKEGLPNVEANEKKFNVDLGNDVIIRGVIDRIDKGISGDDNLYHVVDYKGLALDTPIPTPNGWTTMGDIKEGDKVIGFDGTPTEVLNKSKIHNRPCYRITFSDNSSIICDNVHLWRVSFVDKESNIEFQQVISAEEIFKVFLITRDNIIIESGKPNPSIDHNWPQEKNREIIGIESVSSVPTQCIKVAAKDSMYLCGESMIPTHNTGKSAYLDEFQLLVYGIDLMEKNPDMDNYKASYLALKEDMKWINYMFSRTDVEKVKEKILEVAGQIREDKTWEAKPSFLCKWCDYNEVCEFSSIKQEGRKIARSGEIDWE